MKYSQKALRRLLSENKAITLADPRALAKKPVRRAMGEDGQ